ncbi:MAG: 2-octaprenyl-6-methoxyphenyl hydroxylase [Gammaproteobacteria bacterium]|nr:2-octaprenyl-6-methoxyphenyl hydroxylase [Gammaproteobacteria bacterium]
MGLCRSESYDLVIVGAGMVGASLACILERSRQHGALSILLVESAVIDLDAPAAQPSFDARSTVLSYGTIDYLRELGLWEELKSDAEAIQKIHVSDQGKFGAVRMDNAELGVDALGYVIENRLLGKMFNKRLAAIGNLEICSGVSVSNIKPEPSGMKVTLEDGTQQSSLTTALVVMAEGGRSGLCEKLGIHRTRESYQQEAIIANVAFTRCHENVAYERFTPNGPLALLPLPDHDNQHRAALVWTRNTDDVSSTLALSDSDFLRQLNEEFGNRLGRFTRVGQRNSYPLSLIQAQEQVRPGLVLLGNVAHSLHPVAGQGFNLAFRDTAHLASILLEAMATDTSLGDVALLHRYQEETRSDQHMTAMFSHYMTRLFSSKNIAAVWIRKFGLFSIDLVMPVRKAFARRAMGMGEAKVTLEADA